MKRHKVSITVEGKAIRVSPDPVIMTSEDELHWGSSGGDRFTVDSQSFRSDRNFRRERANPR